AGATVTVWARVSVCGAVRPPSRTSHRPACTGKLLDLFFSTPAVAFHGVSFPASKPGFRSSSVRLIVWVNRHPPLPLLALLAHTPCIANFPVGRVSRAIRPGPACSQAHLSAVSSPPRSTQPPAGFWSVIVSAYSWPATIETPSSLPALPARRMLAPQSAPAWGASVTEGMLVNATSPTGGGTAPSPLTGGSPFQSCQAQNPAAGG